ncbi:hypothetical protein K1719_022152 [Acacia pycnantha]|nr:hypothetical protein K1719_022152 [Acacia pycnantha]
MVIPKAKSVRRNQTVNGTGNAGGAKVQRDSARRREDEVVMKDLNQPTRARRVDKRNREVTEEKQKNNSELSLGIQEGTSGDAVGPSEDKEMGLPNVVGGLLLNQSFSQPIPHDPGASQNVDMDSGQACDGLVAESPMLYEVAGDTQSGSTVVPETQQYCGILPCRQSLSLKRIDSFSIRCSLTNLPPFSITAVYAVPHSNLRAVLWENLVRLSKGITNSWCVIGDFNDISSAKEWIGGSGVIYSRIRWFQDQINDANLSDLGSIGPTMTWRGPRSANGSRLFERLDRVLANNQFLNCFPENYVKELVHPRFHSMFFAAPLRDWLHLNLKKELGISKPSVGV